VNLSKRIYASESGEFNFNAELGFKRDNWRWSASGGSFIYSTFAFRDTAGVFANIPVISYEQTINTPYVGATASYRDESFSLFLRVAGSPLVFAETVDQHYLRSLTITDTFSSGKMVNVDMSGTWHISGNVDLSMNYSYVKYYENRGDAHYNYYVTGVQLYGPFAAMALDYHTVGLGMSYSF